MRKAFGATLAVLFVAVVLMGAAQFPPLADAVTGTLPMPTTGQSPSGASKFTQVDAVGHPLVVIASDGGAVQTNNSATVGAGHIEACAALNYDAGQVCDGGTAVCSRFPVPAGTRSVLVENEGPNGVRLALDGNAPVSGKRGMRLAGLGAGESAVAEAKVADCSPPACSYIDLVTKTADQATGACAQISTLR